MATYTAVLKVPDGFAQDALQAFLESEWPNVEIVFLGPDNLVSGVDDPEPWSTEVQRVRMEVDGLAVDVVTERTQDGPRLRLEGSGADLDGELPGEYWLRPLSGGVRLMDPPRCDACDMPLSPGMQHNCGDVSSR